MMGMSPCRRNRRQGDIPFVLADIAGLILEISAAVSDKSHNHSDLRT